MSISVYTVPRESYLCLPTIKITNQWIDTNHPKSILIIQLSIRRPLIYIPKRNNVRVQGSTVVRYTTIRYSLLNKVCVFTHGPKTGSSTHYCPGVFLHHTFLTERVSELFVMNLWLVCILWCRSWSLSFVVPWTGQKRLGSLLPSTHLFLTSSYSILELIFKPWYLLLPRSRHFLTTTSSKVSVHYEFHRNLLLLLQPFTISFVNRLVSLSWPVSHLHTFVPHIITSVDHPPRPPCAHRFKRVKEKDSPWRPPRFLWKL